MKQFVFISCVFLTLTGCHANKPFLMRGLPEGDDSYSQGFQAGCNTFTGIIGSGMLRMNKMEYDPMRALDDPEYYKGYRLGSTYCTYYIDTDPL